MLVMKFKGAVLQNQETLAEIKNRIKEQNCCSIVVVSIGFKGRDAPFAAVVWVEFAERSRI